MMISRPPFYAFFVFSLVISATARMNDNLGTTNQWDYAGNILCPYEWSKVFKECGGMRQSPINFNTAITDSNSSALRLDGKCDTVAFTTGDTGHQWTILNGSCNAQSYRDNCSYQLAKFHVHSPSEHTVHHARYDGELHFVHISDNSKLLVIGVFLDCSAEYDNEWVQDIFEPLYGDFSDAGNVILNIHPIYSTFLSANDKFYNYEGSLTTPPCSENVDWWVVKEPVKCSRRQLEKLLASQKILELTNNGSNARPIQRNEGIVKIIN